MLDLSDRGGVDSDRLHSKGDRPWEAEAGQPTTYHDRAAANAAAGKDTFDYSTDAIRSANCGRHQTLDP